MDLSNKYIQIIIKYTWRLITRYIKNLKNANYDIEICVFNVFTNDSPGAEAVVSGEDVETDVVLVLDAVESVKCASSHVAVHGPLHRRHAHVPGNKIIYWFYICQNF